MQVSIGKGCYRDMKNFFSNSGYFLKEAFIMFKLNLLSNILSIFSMGLILFILAMVISGWWMSNKVTEAIQGDAEINIFFNGDIGKEGALRLAEKIKGINGVRTSKVINENEAYNRMVKILGKEAKVLTIFEANPFSSFIEVNITLEKMDAVLVELNSLKDIEYVRDNREVLDRLRSISGLLNLLGYLILIAVGISTVVIISHIIRQGVYNNREQIYTLRLLGAPRTFIASPFLLEGLWLTICGGALAAFLAAFTIKQIYAQITGPLPFIPLPPAQSLISGMAAVVMFTSTILGITGSLLGLLSREK